MNIYVSNLSFAVKDEDLRDFFAEYGEVASAKVIMDKFTNRSRGFAFVEMPDEAAAQKAIQELKALHVEFPQLDPDAVKRAGDFVSELPETVPLPEFAADPDGSVSLDWIQSNTRRLTVSMNKTGGLPFAWMKDDQRQNGVIEFSKGEPPERLLRLISQISFDF